MPKQKQKYRALEYASACFHELWGKEVTVKFWDNPDSRGDKHPWVDIYIGRKKIWDCNRVFFDEHFVEVNHAEQTSNQGEGK